jgi:3-oxoacyl-[acyl-carrier-protein] synthase II
MALEDAGLPLRGDLRADFGVCISTALGGVAHAEHQHELFLRQGIRAVNPALALLVFGGSGASHIAIEFGLAGPGNTNSNSCASGTIVLGEAFHLIRAGRANAMLAGGAEAPLVLLTFGAFDTLHALSGSVCRPFDARRDGFVMGEGAAMLVLEERGRALHPRHARRCRPSRRAMNVPCRDGVFLAGDALRVTEPFTGQGIFFALRTAELAAEAILTGSDYAAAARDWLAGNVLAG